MKLQNQKGGNIADFVYSGATMSDANYRVSNIIAVDVQASLVVIHVTQIKWYCHHYNSPILT